MPAPPVVPVNCDVIMTFDADTKVPPVIVPNTIPIKMVPVIAEAVNTDEPAAMDPVNETDAVVALEIVVGAGEMPATAGK